MRLRTPFDIGSRKIFTLFRIGSDSSGEWVCEAKLEGMDDFQKLNLSLALADIASDLHEMVDVNSAERKIKDLIASRVNKLAKKAMAAGKTSDMWNNEKSRFYKARMKIMAE